MPKLMFEADTQQELVAQVRRWLASLEADDDGSGAPRLVVVSRRAGQQHRALRVVEQLGRRVAHDDSEQAAAVPAAKRQSGRVTLVARTAQVAWLAVTLSLYVSYFVPLDPLASKLLGVGAIGVFAAINYRGVSAGALVQKGFTVAKVVGLLIIIGSAFFFRGKPAPATAGHMPTATMAPSGRPTSSARGFSTAACSRSRTASAASLTSRR